MYNQPYTKTQLDEVYQTLTHEQKTVLDTVIKRGKKTAWLNELAKMKGIALSEDQLNNPDTHMDELLDWVLIDYIDAQAVTSTLKCECGRSLRYQYTIKNKTTGIIHQFGKEHFKQHTGLDDQTVIAVTKGLERIDLERHEILTKVKNNIKYSLPTEIKIPTDIQQQIEVGLPLLDRQYTKLMKQYAKKIQVPKSVPKELPKKLTVHEQAAQANINDLLAQFQNAHLTVSTIQVMLYIIEKQPSKLQAHHITKQDLVNTIQDALSNTKKITIKAPLQNLLAACKRYQQ